MTFRAAAAAPLLGWHELGEKSNKNTKVMSSSKFSLGTPHTCWWEGQSQAPTSREPLFVRFSAAAATGRSGRAARLFAGGLCNFNSYY